MTEKQPFKYIVLNTAYIFIVLAVAILAAMASRIILNIFVPIDLLPDKGGDYSRNFYLAVSFVIAAVLAVIAYYFLFVYMMEWFLNLPTWYLSGALASLFGLVDASNIYNTVAEGAAEIENIWLLHYLWLHVLLELAFIVGACVVMRIARRHGEDSAFKEHEAQIAELEQEKERLANAKTLKR